MWAFPQGFQARLVEVLCVVSVVFCTQQTLNPKTFNSAGERLMSRQEAVRKENEDLAQQKALGGDGEGVPEAP